VAGTSSDAGKSLVVTGLCRALARRGIGVAPFKAQNMSNNSAVCADGAEIGRAQYLQAQAAGVEPSSAMNPVLLKPGSDRRSHVVLRGRPYGTLESGEYATGRAQLAAAAFDAYDELAEQYEVIICEGAGSPAEINLRAGDYVNLGLARAKGLPVTVVGDIDRGGVLAALFGTVALLDEADRAMISSFMINKFRGDPAVLQPGLEELARRTGVPFVGVLPWLADVWLDGEDALDIGAWRRHDHHSADLRIAVVRLPRVSNVTDVDALAAEPGVQVQVTADLGEVIQDRARRSAPILGICGGYQMLATKIIDDVESDGGQVDGLGLLPTKITFSAAKVLGQPHGSWREHPVTAYEIHHGHAEIIGAVEPFLDGCRRDEVWGTMWHGAFENDAFRRAWLADRAVASSSDWRPERSAPGYGERRETMINILADAIDDHVELPRLLAGTRIGDRL